MKLYSALAIEGFDSVSINKTSIHKKPNGITEAWNTAFGDKYVTYNNRKKPRNSLD